MNKYQIAAQLLDSMQPATRHSVPQGLLVKDVKSAMKEVEEKRDQRAKNARTFPLSIADRIQALWDARHGGLYGPLSRALPSSGYKMGELKEITVKGVQVDKYSTCREYSNSCKYKAKHGHIYADLSIKDIPNARIIGGIVTVVGERIGRGLRRCIFFTDGQYYQNCDRRIGYLCGDYHFTAASDKEAKEVTARYYKGRREQEKKERHMRGALRRSNTRTWVTAQDSYNGGNCKEGTENFARILRIDLNRVGAVRADVILRQARKHNLTHYATRAVNAAKMRYAN